MYCYPSYEEVLEAARATVEALRNLGYKCCLVGGVACRLLGNERDPNDVDIVVLDSGYSQESLKSKLVSSNSDFYLVSSKNPSATYKLLWYRLSFERSCKIDLLQPGVMKIPFISTKQIRYIDSLPIMPFSIVLLLKLQAWESHRDSFRSYLIDKQYTDVADIDYMLPIALKHKVRPIWEIWIPKSFLSEAKRRVKDYIKWFPRSKKYWIGLGFQVPNKATSKKLRATIMGESDSLNALLSSARGSNIDWNSFNWRD